MQKQRLLQSTLGREILAKASVQENKESQGGNPERRTHVMAVLLGSDGQYYYGGK